MSCLACCRRNFAKRQETFIFLIVFVYNTFITDLTFLFLERGYLHLTAELSIKETSMFVLYLILDSLTKSTFVFLHTTQIN